MGEDGETNVKEETQENTSQEEASTASSSKTNAPVATSGTALIHLINDDSEFW
jgi:hypothetical protein